jgi:hypothetical protein
MLLHILATHSDWFPIFACIILGILFAHGPQKVFGWFGGPGLKQTLRAFRPLQNERRYRGLAQTSPFSRRSSIRMRC